MNKRLFSLLRTGAMMLLLSLVAVQAALATDTDTARRRSHIYVDDSTGHFANIMADTLTGARLVKLPDASGTMAIFTPYTNAQTFQAGDLLYAGSNGSVLSRLGAGTNGYILTLQSGVPSWQPNSGAGGSFVIYDKSGTVQNTLTNPAHYLFDVGYGSLAADNPVGASITVDASGRSASTASGLTISATGGSSSGQATALSLSASDAADDALAISVNSGAISGAPGSGSDGGLLVVQGGAAGSGGHLGGELQLTGGAASGSSAGGDVVISGGSSPSGTVGAVSLSPNGGLTTLNGGLSQHKYTVTNAAATTTNYTIDHAETAKDVFIDIDASHGAGGNGPVNITLPSAADAVGRDILFTVKANAASPDNNAITILPSSNSEKISGTDQLSLSQTNSLAELVSDGVSNWYVKTNLGATTQVTGSPAPAANVAFVINSGHLAASGPHLTVGSGNLHVDDGGDGTDFDNYSMGLNSTDVAGSVTWKITSNANGGPYHLRITFSQPYVNPVVILTPANTDGTDQVVKYHVEAATDHFDIVSGAPTLNEQPAFNYFVIEAE